MGNSLFQPLITMINAGYSGTPLVKKLGIKAGYHIRVINQPDDYESLLDELPAPVSFYNDDVIKKNFIHFFVVEQEQLVKTLPGLKKEIVPNGMIWVSWPKKTSKIKSTVTEDVVRNIALSIGLVDIKVCAINEIWSALKLVIPVKDRK